MTAHLNRHKAASRARQAQALMGVLVIGGGAALAVGLKAGPSADVPKSPKPEIPVVELPNRAAPTRVALDTGGLAERLSLVSNAPKPLEPPPVVATTGPDQTAIVVTPPRNEIRYLGAVMGSKNMALVSDAGKQRFVAVGDSFAGGTVESITDGQIKIGGDSPRTIELASHGNDVLTRGHAATGRPGQNGVAVNRPGNLQQGLTVVKPAPMMASGQGGMGINGEEVPPVPDYIRPDQAKRYDQIREEQRARKAVGSEAELVEFAAKLLSTEDPKSVNPQGSEKAATFENVKKKGKS